MRYEDCGAYDGLKGLELGGISVDSLLIPACSRHAGSYGLERIVK